MTVTELLEAIIAAYAGATPEAMKTFVRVFHDRLARHEGPALAKAASEVLGTFKPKFDQKFPIPVDFEAHLPSGKLHLPSDGPAIDFKGQRERKRALVSEWQAGQGAKIREARGPYVWAHCLWTVQAIAQQRAWDERAARVVLTAEQIQTCEDQAVSTARLSAQGAAVLRHGSNAEWDDQVARYRALVRVGRWPKPMAEPGESSVMAVSQAMLDRLSALARQRREAQALPEVAHG